MSMFYRESTFALTNFATNGSVGTAATTVDRVTRLTFTQTTANITVTLPNPTTAGQLSIVLENLPASTAIINVTGAAAGSDILSLTVGDIREISWNGSSWRAVTPLRSLVLSNAVPSGLLGGITWSVAGTGPPTLSTSVVMTGMVMCELIAATTNTAFDAWVAAGSGGASNLLMRGQCWSGSSSGSLGILANSSYHNTIEGYLVGNSRTFRLTGQTDGTGTGWTLVIDQVS